MDEKLRELSGNLHYPRKDRSCQSKVSCSQGESDDISTINAIARVLSKSRRIVGIVGAGLSVGAGIPDFRSQDGIFQQLGSSVNRSKQAGKEFFDASVYSNAERIGIFHRLMCSLYESSQQADPTIFHRLFSLLSENKRLLRLYTQNIDHLDASLPYLSTTMPLHGYPKTVQLHGSVAYMVCTRCNTTCTFDPKKFASDTLSPCPQCEESNSVRQAVGKRLLGVGTLRPRVVLYNEFNPDSEAIGTITAQDLTSRPDALLVVGTTLKVPGVKRIVKEMIAAVSLQGGKSVWISRDPPPTEFKFDIICLDDCQSVASQVKKEANIMHCTNCNSIKRGGRLVQCGECYTWQHASCVGLETKDSKTLRAINYKCKECLQKFSTNDESEIETTALPIKSEKENICLTPTKTKHDSNSPSKIKQTPSKSSRNSPHKLQAEEATKSPMDSPTRRFGMISIIDGSPSPSKRTRTNMFGVPSEKAQGERSKENKCKLADDDDDVFR